ncbi:shK domain-like domain-containing protein [Ditylenchus destructor]|nr:shK domain-like domain-containing protein [Ditylenchus destructor]
MLLLNGRSLVEATSRCTAPSGNALSIGPTAEGCKDELSPADCRQNFGINAASTLPADPTDGTFARPQNHPRAPRCTQGTLTILANKCRDTCALCCDHPNFNCKNSLDDTECKNRKADCTKPEMRNLMIKACPATCGFCNEAKEVEVDLTCFDAYGKTNCEEMSRLCYDTRAQDDMRRNCMKTCRFCTPGQGTTTTTVRLPPGVTTATTMPPRPVVTQGTVAPPVVGANPRTRDIATNCKQNEYLCDDRIYADIMNENCAATCAAYLGTDYGTEDCFDQSDACDTWDNNFNFCYSTWYTEDEKEAQCAYTCGYC